MFYLKSKTTIGAVKDGLSNTLMAGEIIVIPDTAGHDLRGRYYNTYQGNVLYSTLEPPNTSVGDRSNYCINTPPYAPCQSNSDQDDVQFARSYHPGGVNVAFADGAARFIGNDISRGVFHSLGTRASGEPIPDF
jgi:prepilin-type processing-associated H-X9-DG protein